MDALKLFLPLTKWLTSLYFLCLPSAALEGPRKITPTVLKSSTGLEGVFCILSLTEVIYIFRTLCCREVCKFYNLIYSLPQMCLDLFFFFFSYPVSKLSPKKWGVSGSSQAILVAFFGGVSFLISEGIDIRPNLAVILGLAFIDSIFLGGCCLAQISSYWPPNRRRILVHEAGHLLIGKPYFYLIVCTLKWI